MSDLNIDELFEALQPDFGLPEKKQGRTAREERIISGFEEIQQFVQTHSRLPLQDESQDIFERIYAVRLEALRASEESRQILHGLDVQNLLGQAGNHTEDDFSDDELLSELQEIADGSDITKLTHVRSHAERFAVPEYIANREPCEDFEQFAPLFEQVKNDLKEGIRQTRPFNKQSGIRLKIEQGDFFIIGGQTAYIAEIGEDFKIKNGDTDSRLRVIFDNKTESDMLSRSLQRALYRDDAGRRITARNDGLLFGSEIEEGDIESGTIYVLRSLSDHPLIQEHRNLIHKIGITGGKVETRIANAEHDATFLLAKVEVVAEYKLSNINRSKLEKILHKLFAAAQLDITIQDRFGHPVQPKEWFLLPLNVIDEAVQAILNGTITQLSYNPETAQLA